MAKIGFVGLGTMGSAMADHIYLAGHDLAVFNRSKDRTKHFSEQGIPVADNMEDLGEICDQIYICVRGTEDVEQCLAHLTKKARPGTLFVDHSTISPSAAKEFHGRLVKRDLRFVDAPVTGGSVGAQKGTLTVFCGGDPKDIVDALQIMQAYAKRVERVGGPGTGQTMKMANQIAVAGSLLALCESMAFAESAGLDLAQTRELLAGGAAGSWALDNYGPKIVAKDWSPGFTVENQTKDLQYCEAAAKEVGSKVPGTALVRELLEEMIKEGHGNWTTAALFEKLKGK